MKQDSRGWEEKAAKQNEQGIEEKQDPEILSRGLQGR